MSDFATRLEACMASRNFQIHGKIDYSVTGEFQRFPDGSKPYSRKRDLFVALHDYDRGATFGDWHYPDDWFTFWNNASGKPTVTDLENRKQEAMMRKARQVYDRAKAEWRAKQLWAMFYVEQSAANHPYVIRKGIIAHYARQVRSWLLVPVHDVDHNVCTLQIIKPDGFKRLWKGTSQKDHMIWLSDPLEENYGGTILCCEGYATGCTLRSVSNWPVVCAINANNLFDTVRLLRDKFPGACIKICADNDAYNPIENIGIGYGRYAARMTGATITWPDFTGLNVSQKPTDFNDLIALTNAETVKRQIILNKSVK